MKALAVAALVLALAGSARAEDGLLGRANGPWFVGASAQYIRDGRFGYVDFHHHYGPTGWGYGLEAGRRLQPWLSISLIYRLANLSELIGTDPGTADFTERQLRLGPRIDLWPVPGRLRMGAAFVRSWRRSETVFDRTGFSRLTRTSDNTYELQVGVVPLRWHGFELELSGSFSREPSAGTSWEGRFLSTFSVGFGLRWRTGGAPRPAAPPPTTSSSAGRRSWQAPPGTEAHRKKVAPVAGTPTIVPDERNHERRASRPGTPHVERNLCPLPGRVGGAGRD